MVSKTQIDKLGERLRAGKITEGDLRELDKYRRSFSEAYEFVVTAIRHELELEPTGRPAKSTTSIVEKLRRESIRLTQMQDIAGCRILVANMLEQRRVVASYGYRAVHVIVKRDDKLVEIQVRTLLQHVWAELSEKFSDIVHPSIKYGAGDERIVGVLLESSRVIAGEESNEVALENLEMQVLRAVAQKDFSHGKEKEIFDLQAEIRELKDRHSLEREKNLETLRHIVNHMRNEGDDDAVSH